VISFIVLTYDWRTLSETFSDAVESPKSRKESPGNREQNDSPADFSISREARDVGSAYVYPVQVDLTEWTRKFERKFEDLTKLVDLRFNVLDSQMKEKFKAMDRRQNEMEKLTSARFEEIKESINQFEIRLSESKTETETRLKEWEIRIKDEFSRPTEMPDSSTNLSPGMSAPSETCVKMKADTAIDPDNYQKRYKEFNGKCYLFYPKSPFGWPYTSTGMQGEHSARSYCQGFGADLIAVETSAENEFIKRVLDVEERDTPYFDDFWLLGGKRIGIRQPFYWLQTGDKIEAGFTDWAPGFPDRPYTRYHRYVWVIMHPRSESERKWGAFPNGASNIICEA